MGKENQVEGWFQKIGTILILCHLMWASAYLFFKEPNFTFPGHREKQMVSLAPARQNSDKTVMILSLTPTYKPVTVAMDGSLWASVSHLSISVAQKKSGRMSEGLFLTSS